MGVKYEGTSISQTTGTEYKCQLIDINFVGTKTLIELGGNGFDLTYMQQGDERFAGIKGSEVDLHCIITDDAIGAALLSWINSAINDTKEDQYFVKILKDNDLFWYGVILPDLNVGMDQSKPYSYHIKATDGLARLKDFEFTLSQTEGTPQPFTTMIWNILQNTPLYLSGENILFSTCVEWYETNMRTRAITIDPLSDSRISPNTYTIKEQNQVDKGMSMWDVLTNICEQWGMRIILSEGLFRFYQINVYEDDGVTKFERFYKSLDGLADSWGNFGYNLTLSNSAFPYTLAGNQWSFYPPLRSVNLKYPIENANMLNTLEDMTLIPPFRYSETLRPGIFGGTDKRLNFICALNINIYDITRIGLAMNVTIAIKLKLGTKYLKKDPFGATVSWTTTSTDRYEFVVENVYYGITPINISFSTPDIPIGTYDANEFYIEVSEIVESIVPNVLTPNTDYWVSRVLGSTSLLYNTTVSNNKEAYNLFSAQNTAALINSYIFNCNDAVFGEPYDKSNPGALYIWNGTSEVVSTLEWRLYDTGPPTNFNQLRCNETLSGQIRATRKYQGGILGSVLVGHSSFDYDGYRYILNGGSYSANTETWQGEWFSVSIDRTDTVEVDNGGVLGGDGGTQELRREIGGVSNRLNDVGFNSSRVFYSPFAASATLEPISQVVGSSTTSTLTLPHAYDANASGTQTIEITICNTATTTNPTLTVISQDSAIIAGEGTSIQLTKGQSATFITDGVNWFIK